MILWLDPIMMPESSGYGAFPDVEDYYEVCHTGYTTTICQPMKFMIWAKEVARIRSEMKKVMQEVGFKGTLLEFFEHVRTKRLNAVRCCGTGD